MRLFLYAMAVVCSVQAGEFRAIPAGNASDVPPHQPQRDLIIVAGQSNAVGYDANAADLPPDPADAQVAFWWHCGDDVGPNAHDSTSAGQWHCLQPQPLGTPYKLGRVRRNFRHDGGGFGPEIGMARQLSKVKGAKPLAVVKVAFSGTGFADKNWNPGDRCYQSLVTEVKAAMAAAQREHTQLNLRALMWMQGENDTKSKAAAAAYENRLMQMITALRKELNAPRMAVVMGFNQNTKNAGLPIVIAAQKHIAENPEALARYVDTDGAEQAVVGGHVIGHFNAKGELEVGRRFAAALLDIEKTALAHRKVPG